MQWRVWGATGLLLAIGIGGVLALRRTERLCDALSAGLDASYSDGEAFQQAYDLWKHNTSYFSALVSHDHVDAISDSFSMADGFLAEGTMDEYHAELGNLLQQLSLLREYDLLTVRSLF